MSRLPHRFLKRFEDPFTRKVLFTALLLQVLAAFLSTGYHHYDEHYQILEWASAKLGFTPLDRLPWEYEAAIRPWLQPGIAYLLSKTALALGLFDPFAIATLLRLSCALLSWWVTVKLVECCSFWFPDPKVRRFAIFSTALPWFLPYLSVRFSSENLSGIFFLLGMIPLIQLVNDQARKRIRPNIFALGVLCGAAWGAAFQFRYQTGFLIAPAFFWAWKFIDKKRQVLPSLIAGFSLLFVVGLVIDFWGYGVWTFTAWNYFYVNVLQSKANEWGTAPFWFYFSRFFTAAPPLSSLFVLGTVACWVVARRFSLTWLTFSFVMAHSLVGHKELRFLFPILPLTPLLAAMALQKSAFLNRFFIQRPLRWSTAALVGLNFLFMFPLLVLPTRTEIAALRLIWNENPSRLWVSGINPYAVPGVEAFFYRPFAMETISLGGNLDQVDGYVVCLFPATCLEVESKKKCADLGGSMPNWIESRMSPQLRERARLLDWHLLRCESVAL